MTDIENLNFDEISLGYTKNFSVKITEEILDKFASISGDIDPTAPYAGESYDAAALIVLAMQAGGSADRTAIVSNIKKVANAPGDVILPGELAKGLEILAAGGDIDYQGATDVELSTFGDAAGSFKEVEVQGGKFEMIQIRN